MKIYPLLMLGALLGLSQCQKNDPAPVDQLPPATQTGANTFGCLLNGQPWTPQGNNGKPNFTVSYDPGYAGGALQVKTYRYVEPNQVRQGITFGAANVTQAGFYSFDLPNSNSAFYTDLSQPSPCDYIGDPPRVTYQKGTLTITRLDLTQGVVSGTFSFTLYQPGCDTVRVTNGRFDKKL
ncbi:DUF6252 family protein [Hymenobacter glacialis]|uniref:Lipoprotein n=1 Tax=Hymenobacter glacialis TaxID=1908236 RepID=A0A1G1TAD3_9BACT|nr:DUF6252 family protein [Hymenobacter glacialis]OGX87830.1 hypothetical protein BEN48_10925 [Hymenobacter glacialis]